MCASRGQLAMPALGDKTTARLLHMTGWLASHAGRNMESGCRPTTRATASSQPARPTGVAASGASTDANPTAGDESCMCAFRA
jgi:hypothetical protein